MARGKKYTNDYKEQAYLMYATCENFNEVSRRLGVPVTTIKTWIDKKKPDGLDELRTQKKMEFVDKASEIIDLALNRLKEDIENREKDIPVNQLTTVIGTLYDKCALAKGETTQNTKITFTLPEGLSEYAK